MNGRLVRFWGIGVIAVMVIPFILLPDLAEACAVCLAGESAGEDPAARGFYWGILFLMSMPFALVGSIGGWVFWKYRRAEEKTFHRAPIRLVWSQEKEMEH
jgi:hypothetical protein